MDPDGLTLGDNIPALILSTYTKEMNEQTNNIFKCFKSASNK